MTNYGPAQGRAKWPALWPTWLIALAWIAPLPAQKTHVVRLEVEPERELYRFVPARVTVRAGDVVRFRVSSGGPHNVTFEATGLSPAVHEALNAAMPNRSSDLSGPVLDRTGAEFRLVVPAIPPGSYGFYCTPHRAYDMRGELIVVQ